MSWLRAVHLLCIFSAVLLPCAVHADHYSRPTGHGAVFLTWSPLSPELLAQLRGGFIDISGLKISFGLERMVWVNGQLVQSLTLTFPDLTSLPLQGSAGAVSVQGPAPIVVTIDPVKVNVEPVNVRIDPLQVSLPRTSGMANPPQVRTISPSAVASAAPAAVPVSVSSVVPQQTGSAGPGSAVQQQGSVAPAQANPTQTGTSSLVSNALSQGAGTTASVIQNGPGNIITSDVLNNLGPGVLTVIQNTLNDQTLQGLTILNAEVSGLRSLIRDSVLSNLPITLRGFGR